MDQRPHQLEFILEAFADPSSVQDVVRGMQHPPASGDTPPFRRYSLTRSSVAGILHTIFFMRFFPPLLPATRPVLGVALPHISDQELETTIDQRTAELVRQLEAERAQGGSGRAQVTVAFLERRRRNKWYGMRGDEEVCWENWTVKVTVAEPRTESGT
jgi:autophagy-related protein 101